MKNKIENIDFNNIDLSDFQEEVDDIRNDIKNIKKNKKLMKILKKVDKKRNEDKKLLLLIPFILLFIILLSIVMFDNYNTRKINNKLKKEKFEYKQELKKYKIKSIEKIVKGE